MKIALPIEKIHPQLHEIVQTVGRKCMHNLVCRHEENIIPCEGSPPVRKVLFVDPRFPHMPPVADLRFREEEDGSHFLVFAKEIRNEKYRVGSKEYHSKKSKNPQAIIKTLLSVCKPLTVKSVMLENFSHVRKFLSEWREEAYRAANRGLGYASHPEEFMREIASLTAQGVVFSTELFRKLSTETLPAYTEHMRRVSTRFDYYHVYVLEDGGVYLTKTSDGEKNSRRDFSDFVTDAYPTLETLPEHVLAKVSLLKMLGERGSSSNVGVRTQDHEFYVLEEQTPA